MISKRQLLLFTIIIGSCFALYKHIGETRHELRQRIAQAEQNQLFSSYTPGVTLLENEVVAQQSKGKLRKRRSDNGESQPSQRQNLAQKTPSNSNQHRIDFLALLERFCKLGEDIACEVLQDGRSSIHYNLYQCRVFGKHCVEMANAYEKLGDLQKSIAAYKADCQVNNDSNSCLAASQRLLASESPPQEIQEVLTIACDENNATACVNLAELYLELGHQKLHDQHYKKACELDADFLKASCSQYR